LKRIRTGSALRIAGLAVGMAMAAVGLSATSASALNHDSYNILKNAQLGQRCLDIRTQDAAEGATAQLWHCTNHDEQNFLLVTTSPGGGLFYDEIRPRGTRGLGRCLNAPGVGGAVYQRGCIDFSVVQSWILKDSTGEIVNVYSGQCITATGDFDGASVVTQPCNGSIAQRWFF
jgi:hypothetical protein